VRGRGPTGSMATRTCLPTWLHTPSR
jgi:hypothetical protein